MATLDDILALNKEGSYLDAAGQVIGAASHFQFGVQAAQAAAYQAAQLRQNANSAAASGQHQAEDTARQTALVQSRALAVAAASGGGASDPGVVTIMARNAQEGAYRQAVALFQGQDKARLDTMQAEAKDYEGRSAMMNSGEVAAAQTLHAAGTLVKGQAATTTLMASHTAGSSLFQRFGSGAPNTRNALGS